MSTASLRNTTSLPVWLIETDQLLRRWGSADLRGGMSGGSMHALERIRLLRDGAVFSAPAPEPKEYEIVDRVLATSPDETRMFVVLWYAGSQRTAAQKANVMDVSKAQAYIQLKIHLGYIKGRLNDRGVKV